MDNVIERDMRVFHILTSNEKQSVSDYLNKIASTYPLLGTMIFTVFVK